MNGGVPPTALNARTGELTPPGMTRAARSNNSSELSISSSLFFSVAAGDRCFQLETAPADRVPYVGQLGKAQVALEAIAGAPRRVPYTERRADLPDHEPLVVAGKHASHERLRQSRQPVGGFLGVIGQDEVRTRAAD